MNSLPSGSDLLKTFSDEALPINDQVAASRHFGLCRKRLMSPHCSRWQRVRINPRRCASKPYGAWRPTDGSVVATAANIVADPNAGTAVKLAAIDALSMQMMFASIDRQQRHAIMNALRAALSDQDRENPPVRVAGLGVPIAILNPSASLPTSLQALPMRPSRRLTPSLLCSWPAERRSAPT